MAHFAELIATSSAAYPPAASAICSDASCRLASCSFSVQASLSSPCFSRAATYLFPLSDQLFASREPFGRFFGVLPNDVIRHTLRVSSGCLCSPRSPITFFASVPTFYICRVLRSGLPCPVLFNLSSDLSALDSAYLPLQGPAYPGCTCRIF